MTGIEIAIGFLVAWVVKKVKRVGERVDSEVDQALDAGLDRLHDVVSDALGEDTALAKLETEVEQTGDASERTRDRVRLSLEDAADTVPGLGSQLQVLVDELQALKAQAGGTSNAVAGAGGTAASGNTITATDGSAAAFSMGDVSIGRGGERSDPRQPGQ